MHSREQIRNAFVAACSTISGVTAFNGRIFTVNDGVLPVLSVFSRTEGIDTDQGRNARQQFRDLAVVVQGYLKADTGFDNDVDELSEAVEEVVFLDTTINNLVRCLDLVNTEIEPTLEGEKEMGIITMTFSCKYITQDGQPGIIL